MKLGEVEDYIIENEEFSYPDELYEIDLDSEYDYIEAEGIKIIIPEFGLYMRQGTYMALYEDECEVMPDFSLTLVYDIEESNPQNWLYWESDGVCTTLHNWFSHIGKGSNVYELECEVEKG